MNSQSIILALLTVALPLAAQPLKIPRAEGLVIDGRSEDWAGVKSYHAGRLLDIAGHPSEAGDSSADLRLAWDAMGLVAGIRVLDDDPAEVQKDMYLADSVEIFVASERGGKNRYQLIIAPGMDAKLTELRTHLNDQRPVKTPALTAEAARAAIPGGYFLEARLPWANLGITPEEGAILAVQVIVNDLDGQDDLYRAVWFPSEETSMDSTQMFPIELAAEPSAPPAGQVRAQRLGEEFALRVFCEPSAKERYAEFRDSAKLLARTLIPAGASGCGTLYKPAPDAEPDLFATIDGEAIGSLSLGSKPLTKRDFSRLDYTLVPNVFEGEEFPALQLKNREKIEQKLGPVKTVFRYFDNDYHEVTKPAKPGRYGVEMTLTTRSGLSTDRQATLFRQPAKINWAVENLTFKELALPPGLGIDPAVASEHSSQFARDIAGDFQDNLGQEAWHAIQLGALFQMKSLGHPATYFEEPWRADTDWWYGLRKKLGEIQPLDRMVAVPKGYEADLDKKWPLVLFLHGSGDGDTPEMLKKWGPPKEIAKGREFPFIMVAPRSEPGQWMWWNPQQVGELLDEIEAKYRVDQDRIYVTGLSMGGYGTWYLATEFPDRFAAIAPFCGGGEPEVAPRLAKLPIWAFHGEEDPAVPVEKTREMITALEAAGGHPKVTYYPGIGHQCWDPAYSGTELYDWLLSHKRGEK